MSEFEDFVKTELPLRPVSHDNFPLESLLVRRGVGPRVYDGVEINEGEVLGKVGGVVQSVPGGGGSGLPGLNITDINGQPTLTLVDTTRSNKILSVTENPVDYSENQLNNNDWIRIGNAAHADAGYVAQFDGTVVSSTGFCEQTSSASKDIHIIINTTDHGAIGTLSGGKDVTFINTTIDINFNQGDIIRLQAKDGTQGKIKNTVIKINLKWRG